MTVETKPDHGAEGQAYLVRPSRMVSTEDAGVEARKMEDVTLLDRLYADGRLGTGDRASRRLAAGEWFAKVHRVAFPPKRVVANHGRITGTRLSDEQMFPHPDYPKDSGVMMDPLFWHRRVLRDTERAIGRVPMERIRRLIIDQALNCVPLCIQGDLDYLADHRGL